MDIQEQLRNFKFREPVDESINMNDRVLLIDGLNTFIRNFSVSTEMNSDGELIGGISGTLKSIGAAIRKFRPSRVIIAFDGKGGSQRRRAIYKDYKHNRKTRSRLNRVYDFHSDEDEKESSQKQLMRLVMYLHQLPVTIVAPDNVEADDTLARMALAAVDLGGEAIILSTDRDFLQLVTDKISVYNPVLDVVFTPKLVIEKYQIHPNNFLIYRMITGDDSDNIPGVHGIKIKTLLKFFPELRESTPLDLDDIVNKTKLMIESTKKPGVVLTRLAESRELLWTNKQLMDLKMGQMSIYTQSFVDMTFNQRPPKLDRAELTKMLVNDKFIQSFKDLNRWLNETFIILTRFSEK